MSDLYRYTDYELSVIMGDLRDVLRHQVASTEEARAYLLGEIIAIKRELIRRATPKDAA